jgi:hypothetical protein
MLRRQHDQPQKHFLENYSLLYGHQQGKVVKVMVLHFLLSKKGAEISCGFAERKTPTLPKHCRRKVRILTVRILT